VILIGSVQDYESAQILAMKYNMLDIFHLFPLLTAVVYEAILVNLISETNTISSTVSVLHAFAFYQCIFLCTIFSRSRYAQRLKNANLGKKYFTHLWTIG
jgi:hypothetical protein